MNLTFHESVELERRQDVAEQRDRQREHVLGGPELNYEREPLPPVTLDQLADAILNSLSPRGFFLACYGERCLTPSQLVEMAQRAKEGR